MNKTYPRYGVITVATVAFLLGWFIAVALYGLTKESTAFFGALLGAIATIIAGTFAFYAVQQQILQSQAAVEVQQGAAAVDALLDYQAALSDLWHQWQGLQNQPEDRSRHDGVVAGIHSPIIQRAIGDPILGGDGTALIVFRNLLNDAAAGVIFPAHQNDQQKRAARLVFPLYSNLGSSLRLRIMRLRSGFTRTQIESTTLIDAHRFSRLSVAGEIEVDQLLGLQVG